MTSYEKNYLITEIKCLVIIGSLENFYHYLYGIKYTKWSYGYMIMKNSSIYVPVKKIT